MNRRSQSGFTLIELMIVVAIMALIVRVVMVNIGALIPSSALDSVVAKIQSELAFVRSEARIQGKQYKMQFDLDTQRKRLVLPQEEQLVSSQTAADGTGLALEWMPVDADQRVKIGGYNAGDKPTLVKGQVEIIFDENGFTADQTLYFKLDGGGDEKMIWTLHLWGLNGASQVIRDYDGREHRRQLPVESNF
jgi:type II secretion system protein H